MIDFIWNLFQSSDLQRLKAEAERRGEQSSSLQEKAGSWRRGCSSWNGGTESGSSWSPVVVAPAEGQSPSDDAGAHELRSEHRVLDGIADGKADLTKELIKCRQCKRSHLNTAVVCPLRRPRVIDQRVRYCLMVYARSTRAA